mmetsp:Transcript_72400/g.125623  ORF Transcript_72400/g.125623 Transcript_72400/m.125623 type:complete len:1192 (-) Transcript_72400:80-3655(-)
MKGRKTMVFPTCLFLTSLVVAQAAPCTREADVLSNECDDPDEANMFLQMASKKSLNRGGPELQDALISHSLGRGDKKDCGKNCTDLMPNTTVSHVSEKEVSHVSKKEVSHDDKKEASDDADTEAEAEEEAKEDAEEDAEEEAEEEAEEDADVEADADADAEAEADDAKKEVSHDTTKESSHDAKKEASHDAKKEVSHDAKKEASHNTTKEVSHDAKKEAGHDAKKEVSHDAKKESSDDAKKEVSHDAKKDVHFQQDESPRSNKSKPSRGVTSIEKFECEKYPKPLQLLGTARGKKFDLKQLNVETGKYESIYSIPKNRVNPSMFDLNSCGINPIDNILYCVMTQGENYIVRIDSKSLEYVARLPGTDTYNTATFSPGGRYFVANKYAKFAVVTGVDEMQGVSKKTDSGLTDLKSQKRLQPQGFVQAADAVVVKADLEGIGEKEYLIVANRGLVQVAKFEGGAFTKSWIMKYKIELTPGKQRAGKWGDILGAGWYFSGKVFFAFNKGEGVFNVDLSRLNLRLSEKQLSPFLMIKVGSSQKSGYNDGANCMEVPDPFMKCGEYTCSPGWKKKDGVGKQRGATDEECCDMMCGAYNCTTDGWVTKKGVELLMPPTESKCCEATCGSYECQTEGFQKKLAVALEVSPTEDKCCEATCASYTCTTDGFVKKSGSDDKLSPSEGKCCEATCGSYKCTTTGFVKKAGVAATLAPTESKCCEGTCASYSCTTPEWVKKAGVDATLAPTEDKCCEATCGSYTCATEGWVKKSGVDATLAPTEAKCCEATCASYSCTTEGFVKKASVDFVTAPNEAKCCVATCASHTCATAGWVKKADVASVLAPSEQKCCEPTCTSYQCATTGFTKKKDVAAVTGPTEAKCCEGTCASYSCATPDWVRKSDVDDLLEPDEAKCCEATGAARLSALEFAASPKLLSDRSTGHSTKKEAEMPPAANMSTGPVELSPIRKPRQIKDSQFVASGLHSKPNKTRLGLVQETVREGETMSVRAAAHNAAVQGLQEEGINLNFTAPELIEAGLKVAAFGLGQTSVNTSRTTMCKGGYRPTLLRTGAYTCELPYEKGTVRYYFQQSFKMAYDFCNLSRLMLSIFGILFALLGTALLEVFYFRPRSKIPQYEIIGTDLSEEYPELNGPDLSGPAAVKGLVAGDTPELIRGEKPVRLPPKGAGSQKTLRCVFCRRRRQPA